MKHQTRKTISPIVRVFLTATATFLLLAGCARQGAPVREPAFRPAPQIEAEAHPEAPVTVGTLHPLAYSGVGNGDNTGDAYYEYIRLGEHQEAVIVKTDYATGQQVCICQKPGCTHQDESCNAYIPSTMQLSMWVENDGLYLCYRGILSDDAYELENLEEGKEIRAQQHEYALADCETQEEREACVRFYEEDEKVLAQQSYVDYISWDASEKRRIVEFPLGVNPKFRFSDGAYLFGRYEKGESIFDGVDRLPRERYGFWLYLETGEYGSYPLKGLGGNIECYQDKLVYQTLEAEQNLRGLYSLNHIEALNAALQTAWQRFDAVDPITGARKKLATVPHIGVRDVFIVGDALYYRLLRESTSMQIVDGTIYTVNLTTGAQTSLKSILPESGSIVMQAEIGAILYNGTQDYIAGIEWNESGTIAKSAFINLKTGERIPILFKADEQPRFSPARIWAQANDGRLLVVIGEVVDIEPDYLSRRYYALVQPEELFKKDGSYIEVKPYEIPA